MNSFNLLHVPVQVKSSRSSNGYSIVIVSVDLNVLDNRVLFILLFLQGLSKLFKLVVKWFFTISLNILR